MNPFRLRKPESIERRYAAAIAADEDARGVWARGMTPKQYKRQRFLIRVQDAGLDPLRVAFVVWLAGQGRLSDDLPRPAPASEARP